MLTRVDTRADYPALAILADAAADKRDNEVPEAVRAWREVGQLRHEIDRLREECKTWMNGVADVVEPLGYDRHAACGPSDLLPGLTELRVHGLESARNAKFSVDEMSAIRSVLRHLAARQATEVQAPTANVLRLLGLPDICVGWVLS